MVIRGTPGSPRPQKGDMRIGYAQGPKLITTPVAVTIQQANVGDVLLERTAPDSGEVRNIATLVSIQGTGSLDVSVINPTTNEAFTIWVPLVGGVRNSTTSIPVKKFDIVRVTLKTLDGVEGQPAILNSLGISFDLVTQQR